MMTAMDDLALNVHNLRPRSSRRRVLHLYRLYVCLSACGYVCLYVGMYVCLYVYLYVCLSMDASLYLLDRISSNFNRM